MGSTDPPSTSFDVLIIGAGISGIDSAYRVKTELPNCNYAVLEARSALGGTWDLFRYPGVRSDSDLHTFGFPWRPWLKENTIAKAELIREYLHDCVESEGIDRKIRYQHKMISANWSSTDQKWTLIIDLNGQEVEYYAKFVILCTGYYNYKEPLKTVIPGLSNFKGTVIRPQFWPQDLDYTDKKIIIIGSGATAVTIFPVLAKKAAHVTMLQRSPTYVLATPSVDKSAKFLRRFLSASLVARMMRVKFLVLSYCFFQFCRFLPRAARALLRLNAKAHLPQNYPTDLHFNPRYNPWEQRLCVSPDGDFYAALHQKNADIVTDTIETITEDGIRTTGGKFLETDIIVVATGLNLQIAGGASISVDNEIFPVASKFFWKGVMLQDLPNAAIVLGYTNAAWTLGADSTALLICRLLKYLENNKISSAVPRISSTELTNLKTQPALDLRSTYIETARSIVPMSSNLVPWHAKRNYFLDSWDARFTDMKKGLSFFVKPKVQ